MPNLIEVVDVSKSFDDGGTTIEALKETNFSVKGGEFVAIIGPSGSGKSTLLTIIGGLQQPGTGKVLIKDNKFSETTDKERTKLRFEEIGFILQASNLVPFLTVEKQLHLVNKVNKTKYDRERAEQLLNDLGIADLSKKYPGDLSGGQRQRIGIARALYKQADVLFFDEATSSLDDRTAQEINLAIEQLSREQSALTIVVIAHRSTSLEYCDRIIEI